MHLTGSIRDRWRLPAAAILVALAVAGCSGGSDTTLDAGQPVGASSAASQVATSGTRFEPPLQVADFTLTGMDGSSVSLSDFRGEVVAIYFGYTFCPDMCPLTLGTYQAALAQLPEPLGEEVQVVMVTVDPERDTPEVMGRYMPLFREDFVGLTGDVSTVDAVLANWGIEVKRNAPNDVGAYTVDHPMESWILDREGRLRFKVSHLTGIDALVTDLHELLAGGR